MRVRARDAVMSQRDLDREMLKKLQAQLKDYNSLDFKKIPASIKKLLVSQMEDIAEQVKDLMTKLDSESAYEKLSNSCKKSIKEYITSTINDSHSESYAGLFDDLESFWDEIVRNFNTKQPTKSSIKSREMFNKQRAAVIQAKAIRREKKYKVMPKDCT